MLDLVLKTSDSARLVLLKSNEYYAEWWWLWARPPIVRHCGKWTDLQVQHLERLQLQKCCKIWPSRSRSTEACMLFLRSQRALHQNVTVTCSHDQCWLQTGQYTGRQWWYLKRNFHNGWNCWPTECFDKDQKELKLADPASLALLGVPSRYCWTGPQHWGLSAPRNEVIIKNMSYIYIIIVNAWYQWMC